jgi:ABC-type nitrate/sulfonate/bicarbonate transport system substrate-binding protein
MKLCRIIVMIFFLATLLIMVSCKDAPDEKKLIQVGVQLPWLYQAQFAGPVVADDLGYGKENGIKINVFPGGIDISDLENVANGKIQFGITQPDKLIEARKNGVKIKAVCVIFNKSMSAFMIKKNSKIKTPKDFIGKKVGTKEGFNVHIEYLALLDKLGINRNKINEFPVQYDVTPLLNDVIDVFPCFEINEPYSLIKYDQEYKLILPRDYGLHFYGDIIYTSEKFISENPGIIRKFLKAVIKGWQFAGESKNESNTIQMLLTREPLLDPKHQEFMLRTCRSLLSINQEEIGAMDERVWQEMVGNLSKYVDESYKDIKVKSLFTNDFIPQRKN